MMRILALTGGALRARRHGTRILVAALMLLTAGLWGTGVGPKPTAAATTSPKAYVGLYGESAIGVIDTATGQTLHTITIPAGPEAVIVTPNGQRVYVTSEDETELSVIDTATDKVVKTLKLGDGPEGMALSPDTKTLLVAVFFDNKVDAIDTSTFRVVAQFPVARPHGVAYSPDGRTAYVGQQDAPSNNAIVVLDVPARRVAARLPVDQTPRGLTVSPDAKSVYFTTANSAAVQILDAATNTITAQIPVGPIPHQIAFTPDHKRALVVVQGTGQLAIVDAASHQVVQDVAVGHFPHWVSVTSDGALAYVTNEGDDNISVVDLAKAKVVATLPTGNEPRKISLQHGAGAMGEYLAPTTTPVAAGFAARAAQPAPAPQAGDAQIRMRGFAFGPNTVTVAVGHTVTWIDDDAVPHNATSRIKQWDTGQLVPGGSFTVTMTKPGTYSYICNDHPFMQAKVIVTR